MKDKRKFRRVVSYAVSGFGLAGKLGLGAFASVVGMTMPAQACGPEAYIGTVCAFAFNFCPQGWLPADGRQVPINNNQALFSLISTNYGGSIQSGQFALPDLRGRAVVSSGIGPGLPPQPFAIPSGVPETTLNVSNLPPHNHGATFTGTGGGSQTVNVPASAGTLGVVGKLNAKDQLGSATLAAGSFLGKGAASGGGAANIYVPSNSTAADVELSGLDIQLTGAAGNGPISFVYQSGITGGSVTIGNTGGAIAFSNQSPSLGMSYCIMVNGLYPSRP